MDASLYKLLGAVGVIAAVSGFVLAAFGEGEQFGVFYVFELVVGGVLYFIGHNKEKSEREKRQKERKRKNDI